MNTCAAAAAATLAVKGLAEDPDGPWSSSSPPSWELGAAVATARYLHNLDVDVGQMLPIVFCQVLVDMLLK